MPYLNLFPYSDLYYGIRGKGWKRLTIVPSISEASVTFVADTKVVMGNSVFVPPGTSVTYTVSTTGYNTVTNTIVVTQNTTIPVELEVSMFTLTINPIPASATVVLTATDYEQEGNSITVPYSSMVDYTVSATGYDTISSSIIVLEDTVKTVALEQDFTQPTLTEDGTAGGDSMAVSWNWINADQHTGTAYSIFEPNSGYVTIYRQEAVTSLKINIYLPKPTRLTSLAFKVVRQNPNMSGDAVDTKLYGGTSMGDTSVLVKNIGRVSVNSTAQIAIDDSTHYFQYYTFYTMTTGDSRQDMLTLSNFLLQGKTHDIIS